MGTPLLQCCLLGSLSPPRWLGCTPGSWPDPSSVCHVPLWVRVYLWGCDSFCGPSFLSESQAPVGGSVPSLWDCMVMRSMPMPMPHLTCSAVEAQRAQVAMAALRILLRGGRVSLEVEPGPLHAPVSAVWLGSDAVGASLVTCACDPSIWRPRQVDGLSPRVQGGVHRSTDCCLWFATGAWWEPGLRLLLQAGEWSWASGVLGGGRLGSRPRA